MLCCVPGCNIRSGKGLCRTKRISFFRLPTEPQVLKIFLKKIRRNLGPYFEITKHTRICSEHYTMDDFQIFISGRRELKPGALPSIFAWTSDKQPRKSPKKKENARSRDETTELDSSSNDDPDEWTDVAVKQEPICELNELDAVLELDDPLYIPKFSSENVVTSSDSIPTVSEVFSLASTHVNEQPRTPVAEDSAEKKLIQTLQEEVDKLQQERKEKIERLNTVYFELETERKEKAALQKQLIAARATGQGFQIQAERLQSRLFCFDNVKEDKVALKFYTGMESGKLFLALHKFLDPGPRGKNVVQWRVGDPRHKETPRPTERCGRPRQLDSEDQLLLVLCRLRLDLQEYDIGHRFAISETSVNRTLKGWLNYMNIRFNTLQLWQSKEYVERTMPECFRQKFLSARVILDIVELKCQNPNNSMKELRLKGIIGIAPSGMVTFVSPLYPGSQPDRDCIAACGILNQSYEQGDSIITVKDMDIADILPAGLGSSQATGFVKVHVERQLARMKSFGILSSTIPQTLIPLTDEIWTVCIILSNFQSQLNPLETCEPVESNDQSLCVEAMEEDV